MKNNKCIICGNSILTDQEDEENPRICTEHWKCPLCGIGVDSKDGYGNGLVLEDDNLVRCYACKHDWTFAGIEKAIAKKNSLTVCSCCKGTGMVAKKQRNK